MVTGRRTRPLFTFSLSLQCKHQLAALIVESGENRSALIERLVGQAYAGLDAARELRAWQAREPGGVNAKESAQSRTLPLFSSEGKARRK